MAINPKTVEKLKAISDAADTFTDKASDKVKASPYTWAIYLGVFGAGFLSGALAF